MEANDEKIEAKKSVTSSKTSSSEKSDNEKTEQINNNLEESHQKMNDDNST